MFRRNSDTSVAYKFIRPCFTKIDILKHGAVHNKMQVSEDMGHARLRHQGRIVGLSRKTILDNCYQRIASTHNDTHALQAQATGNRQLSTGNFTLAYGHRMCCYSQRSTFFLSRRTLNEPFDQSSVSACDVLRLACLIQPTPLSLTPKAPRIGHRWEDPAI
jgi:hypothetical protein